MLDGEQQLLLLILCAGLVVLSIFVVCLFAVVAVARLPAIQSSRLGHSLRNTKVSWNGSVMHCYRYRCCVS